MQKDIFKTTFFTQQPAEVWEYLTRPELLELWLGKTDFEPTVGHKFHFVSPYGNNSICEVLDVQPFARLSYSWQKKSLKDNQAYNSTIIWTLIEKENGTELQLQHTGFIFLEDAMGHNTGWDGCLKTMGELMNAGTNA